MEHDDGRDLEIGDTLDYHGEEFIVLDSNAGNFVAYPNVPGVVSTFYLSDYINEQTENDVDGTIYDLPDTMLLEDIGADEYYGAIDGEDMRQIFKDYLTENNLGENEEVSSEDLRDAVWSFMEQRYEGESKDFWQEHLDESFYDGDVGLNGDQVWVALNNAEGRTLLPQPSEIEPLDPEDFNVEDLDESHQGIVRKYSALGKYLESIRPGNVDLITDEKGFQWHEVTLQESDKLPTVLFSQRPRGGWGVAPSTYQRLSKRAKLLADALRLRLTNRYLPLQRVQEYLVGQGWNMVQSANAMLHMELWSSKADTRLKGFINDLAEPLMTRIQNSDVTLQELEDFLYAKFAPARNAHIKRINPDLEAGAGRSNKWASDTLDLFEEQGKTAELESLAADVYAITNGMRDIIRNEGLESEDVVDAWEATNPFYVPLKSVNDGKPNQKKGIGTGVGVNINRSGNNRALGRTTPADNILAHLFEQVGVTIIRSEKAKVGRAFLQMVEENPDYDGFKIFDMSRPQTLPTKLKLGDNPRIKALKKKIASRKFALNRGNPTETRATELRDEIGTFEVELAQENAQTVKRIFDLAGLKADNVLTVTREDGSVVYVEIADQDLANAMKNTATNTNIPFMQHSASILRFLARINTSWNPEFPITNFSRDIQTAMVHLTGEQSVKMAAKVAKNVPKAMLGIRSALRGKNRGEWAEWYDRFRKTGAHVSFLDLQGVNHWENRLKSVAKHGNRKMEFAKNKAEKLIKVVEDYNTVVENAVRLSAFRAAVESGMSDMEAASLAKNLTVNFERKGTWGSNINALYMFANAGIQGSARLIKSIMTSRKTQALCLAAVGAGFSLAESGRVVGGDDDDDVPYWEKVPDYAKQTNFIFMRGEGKEPVKIKLPYGYNLFVNIGYAISDIHHGKPISEVAKNLVSATKNAFNPLGGDDDLMKIIMPTMLDPFYEVETNENFMKSKIKPDNYPFGVQKKEHELYFKSVSETSKEITQKMYDSVGYDVSPEVLDHFFDFVTGGAGRTVGRTVDVVSKKLKGEEVTTGKIPFERQLFVDKSNNRYWDMDRFYTNLQSTVNTRGRMKEMTASERAQYRLDHPDHVMYNAGVKVRKRMSLLRKEYNEALNAGNEDRAKIVQNKMTMVAKAFNKRYDAAVK